MYQEKSWEQSRSCVWMLSRITALIFACKFFSRSFPSFYKLVYCRGLGQELQVLSCVGCIRLQSTLHRIKGVLHNKSYTVAIWLYSFIHRCMF